MSGKPGCASSRQRRLKALIWLAPPVYMTLMWACVDELWQSETPFSGRWPIRWCILVAALALWWVFWLAAFPGVNAYLTATSQLAPPAASWLVVTVGTASVLVLAGFVLWQMSLSADDASSFDWLLFPLVLGALEITMMWVCLLLGVMIEAGLLATATSALLTLAASVTSILLWWIVIASI